MTERQEAKVRLERARASLRAAVSSPSAIQQMVQERLQVAELEAKAYVLHPGEREILEARIGEAFMAVCRGRAELAELGRRRHSTQKQREKAKAKLLNAITVAKEWGVLD